MLLKFPSKNLSFQPHSSLKLLSIFDFIFLNLFMIILLSTQKKFSENLLSLYFILVAFLQLLLCVILIKLLPKYYVRFLKGIFSFIVILSYLEMCGFPKKDDGYLLLTFCLFKQMILDDPNYWLNTIEIPILILYYLLRRTSNEFDRFAFSSIILALFSILRKFSKIKEQGDRIQKLQEESDDGKEYKKLFFEQIEGKAIVLDLEKPNSQFSSEVKKIFGKIIRRKKRDKENVLKSKAVSLFTFQGKLVKTKTIRVKDQNQKSNIICTEKLLDFLNEFDLVKEKNDSNPTNANLNFIANAETHETHTLPIIMTMLNSNKNEDKIVKLSLKNQNQNFVDLKLKKLSNSLLLTIQNFKKEKEQENKPFIEEFNELKQINLMKDKLFAIVSHDMRSPLNGLIYYIKTAKETDNLFLRNQKLNYALTNSNILNCLINDLLDFSLLNKKTKINLCLTKFSLDYLIEEIYAIVEAESKPISFIIQNHCNKNLSLINDERRIKQLLINLINNSFKFTFNGFVKLKISPAPISDNLLKFEIIDTGLGIKPENLTKLMKPFATFGIPEKNINKNGIGLGLYICKTLAGVLGPDENLFIVSEEGKGTKIGFLAYINKENEEINKEKFLKCSYNLEDNFETYLESYNEENVFESDIREAQTKSRNISKESFYNLNKEFSKSKPRKTSFLKKEKSNSSQISLYSQKIHSEKIIYDNISEISIVQKLKILIVDDQKFNLMILEEMLSNFKEFNLSIDKAENGKQAVEKFLLNNSLEFNQHSYDIIFMDYEMPLMNGLEAIQIIKTKIYEEGYRDVKIFICSGNDFAQMEKESQKDLMIFIEDFYTKPISAEKIYSCLKQSLFVKDVSD